MSRGDGLRQYTQCPVVGGHGLRQYTQYPVWVVMV